MRVLFVNAREDDQRSPGGDTIQCLKTGAALEAIGWKVETRAPDQLVDLPDFDLAHVFNLQMPESAFRVFEALHRRGLPIVFSPIYWDVLDLWFSVASVDRLLWRRLTQLAGPSVARRAYVRWQQLKSPAQREWRLQRHLLKTARRVLPNSSAETRLLQTTFALGSDFARKCDVVTNAIDTALYQKVPEPSREFVERHGVRDFVLQVGTISPTKNQLGLLEAVYDLPVPLVFIGHTHPAFADYGAACRARAAARGNVQFIDHLPHEQLPGVYALAAVHALPSWRETPGLVSLEAASAGCRIVTTSIGSARDYFGDLAWYCDPADAGSIRQAVKAALGSPASPALRQKVLREHTWVQAAAATARSYRLALGGGQEQLAV